MNGHFKWIASMLVSILMGLALVQLNEMNDSLKTIHIQHSVMLERLVAVETKLNIHLNLRQDEP